MKNVHLFACSAMLATLAACTTAPTTPALRTGEVATIEGRVTRVDTAPWAYDGNATVGVATSSGDVVVALPARWNLCKAPSPDVQALKVGDRVRVVGTVGEEQTITVCTRAEDRLVRID